MSIVYKSKIYLKYFTDFLKHREYSFVLTSLKYLLFKKTSRTTTVINTQVGQFISRKGTLDFQFANYAYEWSVKSFILNRHKDFDVFMDIGSNVGTYAVLLGNLGMKVYAFEPIIENFRAIMVNIHLNNLEDKVQAFNFGLGAKNREVDFIYNPVNTGASHISHTGENNGIHETVKIKSLDSLYQNFNLNKNDKILLKVDVEGMEPNVFHGARNFLEYFPNLLIVFESKHSGLENIRKILDDIAEFEYMTIDHYNTATKKINQ